MFFHTLNAPFLLMLYRVICIIFITENIILVEMVAKKWRMMMIAARLYIYFPYGKISNKGLWLFICCNIMRCNIYMCSHTIYMLSHVIYMLSHIIYMRSHIIYAQSYNIYAQSYNIYAQTYNIYAQTYNIHAQTYNIYAQSYNIYVQT